MPTQDQATTPDVHAIAIAISAAMPDVWSVHKSEYNCTLTRESDGLELSIGSDRTWNAPADRLNIGQNYHADAWRDSDGDYADPTSYNGRLPSINVTAKKKPATIAKEIVRRLLPDAEVFHARAVARVASYNASQCERDRLAVALGMEPASRNTYNRRTGNPSAGHDLPDAHPDASYARAEVETSSDGVKIELDGLTVEQARAVLAAVGVELPAPACAVA